MRVVFVQDVPNVAEAGEVKEVRRGYAKNYLLPQSLAVPATAEELKRVAALKRAATGVRERQQLDVEALGQRVEGAVVTLLERAGPTGRLYGSVTAADIAAALAKELNISVDRRAVEMGVALRRTGEYVVQVRLAPERVYDVKVVVTTEELLQLRALAQAAAAQAAVLAEEQLLMRALEQEASAQAAALASEAAPLVGSALGSTSGEQAEDEEEERKP